MSQNKKAAERKEYTVKVDSHIHKGQSVKNGAKINLTAKQAEHLKSKGVIL